ncbi:hypothetical protein FQR65_LT04223 [Abscondita terminalis]|nr:hypothetical protein FQR65_LT04223 [Abscondita terminalis]
MFTIMTSFSTDSGTSEKKSKFSFSIDHILNEAGSSSNQNHFSNHGEINATPFPWLQCTRYCPPKIQRVQRRESGTQRRQLGRHPRIPFTTQQLAILEDKFRESPYLSSAEVVRISKLLQLADIRVKIWFQNRRARDRREKLQSDAEQKSLINPYVNSNEDSNFKQGNFRCGDEWTSSAILPNLSNCSVSQTESYLGALHKHIVKDKHTQ